MDCTCKETTCYDCRRQLIDAKAEQIRAREIKYCTGMNGFDIEDHAGAMALDYRNKAINKLTAEFATN